MSASDGSDTKCVDHRSLWTVGSFCLIYSRTKSEWVKAEITAITGTKREEWLVVKYNKKKKKRIQRNCKDIQPDPDYCYEVGSKCRIYSELSATWCPGEVIDIIYDEEGEWLTVKFSANDKGDFMVCDIQRFSKQIKLRDLEDEKKEVPVALNDEYTKFRLIQKTQYNHNCIILRFELQSNRTRLGLFIGGHLRLKYEDNSTDFPISRSYTPISDESDLGFFELLIKVYPDGEMTQFLNKMKVNQYIECQGPLGMICYEKPNYFRIKRFDFDTMEEIAFRMNVKKIGMLAGGTGITPFYQIIKEIHRNKKKDDTKISLICSNKTEQDILLKQELDAIQQENKNIDIFHTISTAKGNHSSHWKGGLGRINMEMIKKHIFSPDDDVVVLLCGPMEFNQSMKGLCKQIGYNEDNVLVF